MGSAEGLEAGAGVGGHRGKREGPHPRLGTETRQLGEAGFTVPPPPGMVLWGRLRITRGFSGLKPIVFERPSPVAGSEANSSHRPGQQRPAERDHSLIPRWLECRKVW